MSEKCNSSSVDGLIILVAFLLFFAVAILFILADVGTQAGRIADCLVLQQTGQGVCK